MTVDTKALFDAAWDSEVQKRLAESPSYTIDDFTVTGRAAAKYNGKRNDLWWADNGPLLVDNWVQWRKDTRWEIWETPDGNPAIELELRVVLPGDILVLMFIDRVFVTPTGEIVVVDLKTGRTPETAAQLGLYATGIELTWGPAYRPTWGFFWDANKASHGSPLNLDQYTPQYLGADYADTVRGINAQSFPAKPANGCANWCGVQRYCAAVGGIDAPKVDPVYQISS